MDDLTPEELAALIRFHSKKLKNYPETSDLFVNASKRISELATEHANRANNPSKISEHHHGRQ
jgi:hypothetical protein